MKLKNILYIILVFVFGIMSYIFIDRGINTKTKNVVNYKVSNDITYKVYLLDNDFYDQKYLAMGRSYVSSIVDDIEFNFNYDKVFNTKVNGYYSYDVIVSLVGYKGSTSDKILTNDYIILDKKVVVLQNEEKSFNIKDKVTVDFDKYREILNNFIKTYGIKLSGYLDVKIRINENLNFKGIKDVITDDNIMEVKIPLNDDTFKIDIDNKKNISSSYYDYSSKERINYLFLVIGAFCFSLSMAFLGIVVRYFLLMFNSQYDYKKELKKICNEHDDILVCVKKFYNKKKYNLIYVDSFDEILDVYKKVGNPILYREVKKDIETVFLITDGDNAWIYRMLANLKK